MREELRELPVELMLDTDDPVELTLDTDEPDEDTLLMLLTEPVPATASQAPRESPWFRCPPSALKVVVIVSPVPVPPGR